MRDTQSQDAQFLRWTSLRLVLFSLFLPSSLLAAPQVVFPADNPWNQRITNAPVAANSDAIMDSIVTTYGNGRLHPDFGQNTHTTGAPLYGIPYNKVAGNSVPHINVVIDAYANQSDIVAVPMPANPVIEGDTQTGPTVGLAARQDSHLIIWDTDNNIDYEFYRCSRPSENADGQWHADAEAVWNFNADTFRPLNWTSADAAGLPILPGLVRPDEAAAASITHAFRLTLQNAVILNQFIYPASHVANPGNTNTPIQPPMGARLRLKQSVNISGLSPQSRAVAQALKDYGLIVADNGSNFFITGASYSPTPSNTQGQTWNDSDIQSTTLGLKSLHFSDFEVVDLAPIVTGLDPPSTPAGSSVTVLGQNFSGAAGHLQVFFGSTPAANITPIDDTHILVTNLPPPAGSGVVDVHVQSGIADPSDPHNINSPIFGYGLSATTPADRFTYAGLGVCCRGATCAPGIASAAACAGTLIPGQTAGSSFNPAAPSCADPANPPSPPPCCLADYNKINGITVQDIFDFLADWFAASPYASTGGNGTPAPLTVQNIFDFLAAWFAGGC